MSDTSRIPDRRQRKSRTALQRGLLDLIPSKAYDAITIEDITAAADVARATFYAHYRDKTALLDEAVRELMADLTDRVGVMSPPPGATVYTAAAVAVVFEHAGEHRDLYRLVLRGEAGAGARHRVITAFEAVTTEVFSRMARGEPRVPLAVTTRAFVGAILLSLEGWLEDDGRRDALDIATDVLLTQVSGTAWALGFADGELRLESASPR